MSFSRLIELVTPPDAPDDLFDGPWEPIEDFVEVTLPDDYKAFTKVYGSGLFMEFISVNIPDSTIVSTFEEELRLSKWHILGSAKPEELDYRLWPDPDGLIMFGSTDMGHYIFWNPKGPAANWSIVVLECRGDLFEEFDCSLSQFLVGLAEGTISPRLFPEDLVRTGRLFYSHTEWDDGRVIRSERRGE